MLFGAMSAALTLLLILLSATPKRILPLADILPLFALMHIYFICLFYPAFLSYVFLFLAGLLQDILLQTPLGLSSLIFLLMKLIIYYRRRHLARHVFPAIWIGFGLAMSVLALLQWGILCAYYDKWLPMHNGIIQWLLTVLLYPPIHLVLTKIYRVLLSRTVKEKAR